MRSILLLAPLLILLSACSSSSSNHASPDGEAPPPALPPSPPPTPTRNVPPGWDDAALAGHFWRLKDARDVNNQRLRVLLAKPGLPFSLFFKENSLQVRNSCTNIIGPYRPTLDGQMLVDPLLGNRKHCPEEGAMEAEAALLNSLSRPFRLLQSPGKGADLVLLDAEGNRLTFEPIPLPATSP